MRQARWRTVTAGLLLLPGSGLVLAAPASEQTRAAAAATMVDDGETRTSGFILRHPPRQGLVTLARAPAGATRVTLDGESLPMADDGLFLLAFDRDAPATAMLRAERRSAPPVEAALTIGAGQWRIEHINAPYRGSAVGDADFARRRPAELDQITAARRQMAQSDGWRQAFIWPVRGRLSGLFGSQRVYQGRPGSYHSGLDIAAPTGTPFVAPAAGVVVLAARTPFTLEGNLLIIDHGMGLTSAFLHAARLDVTTGQVVRQGQPLGTVGATGRATGPHLHWGLRWRTARLDPLPLLPR